MVRQDLADLFGSVVSRFALISDLSLRTILVGSVLLSTLVLDLSTTIAGVQAGVDKRRDQIESHLAAGEFPVAIEKARHLDGPIRDQLLAEIARHQLHSGAPTAAFHTAFQIQLEDPRADLLQDLYGQGFGGVGAGNPPRGNAPIPGQPGGITLQDFQPLINLIQNTISPDSWQDTGQGLGTIQPYPAGVYVSADGTLNRIDTELVKTARTLKGRIRQDAGNRNGTIKSDRRMVSLPKLERAAQWRAAQGLSPDPMMENMAGLYGIEFVTVLPETGDIVIAGPAGDWELGEQGRPVNVDTGQPVLQLDDFVVCLENATVNEGRFGCSIDPREKNLIATSEYLQRQEVQGKRWAEGLRQSLGQQDIQVFGIRPDTHAARVLVEADYRMKLIGMGLEPSIPQVPSYLDRIAQRSEAQSSEVVRWWFTMSYDNIVADQERTMFRINGSGVKVQSENEFLNQQGQRVHTGKANPEAAGFARDFTAHFQTLASKYPVYRQLKNVFDMALVAGLIRKYSLAEKIDWKHDFFVPSDEKSLRYRCRSDQVAGQVDSVMNEKMVRYRKKRSTVTRRVIGVSGGVSFDAAKILGSPLAMDPSGDFLQRREQAVPDAVEAREAKMKVDKWWWD